MTTGDTIIETVRARVAPAGFSLVAGGQVGRYNEVVDAGYRLPDFGGDDRLVVLIGNDRSNWPAFEAAVAAGDVDLSAPHPFDRWVMRTLAPRVDIEGVRSELRWVHDGPPRMVAMQRLATAIGLAETGPAALGAHPTVGTWFALRAAIVYDARGPITTPPPPTCSACVHQPCVPAMTRALDARSWQAWVAVRDACPIGKDHRYHEGQIAFHYSHNAAALRALKPTT